MTRRTKITITQKDIDTIIELFDDLFGDFERAAPKSAPKKITPPAEKPPENFWSRDMAQISYASVASGLLQKQAKEEANRDRMERIADLFRAR